MKQHDCVHETCWHAGGRTGVIVTTQCPFSPPVTARLRLRPLTCAHLRTSFTVAAPGFAHRAAAHLLGEVGGQRMLAAPRLGRYQEALVSRRLCQRRWRGFHLGTRKSHFGMKIWFSQVEKSRGERRKPRMASYSPTHRFLSNTKPALQEHLKLPSVFRQSPFWQTPCMEHSLISSRSGGVKMKRLFWYTVKGDIYSEGKWYRSFITWEM